MKRERHQAFAEASDSQSALGGVLQWSDDRLACGTCGDVGNNGYNKGTCTRHVLVYLRVKSTRLMSVKEMMQPSCLRKTYNLNRIKLKPVPGICQMLWLLPAAHLQCYH
ncbi:hypothetical protein AMECASPLE_003424 [Ameca splendens]|uniref:Uncharacterized protein n=1 Tax=Ameca splendens TaxID=208324 RepID=A0ABV0YKL6_9TELE